MAGRENDLDGLTPMERKFVDAYAATRDPVTAVLTAGYKLPVKNRRAAAEAKGKNLLDPQVNPRVAAAVARAFGAKYGTPVLTGHDVLRYIHTVLTFCPTDFFQPGGDGGWTCKPEEFRLLPAQIKQLVEEVELRTIDMGEGRLASVIWVRIVDKTKALELAAKYQLKDYVEPGMGAAQGAAGIGTVDWDRLSGARPAAPGAPPPRTDTDPNADPVERKILALGPPKPPSTGGESSPPSTNGSH